MSAVELDSCWGGRGFVGDVGGGVDGVCKVAFLLTLQDLKWKLFIRVSQRSDTFPGPFTHLSW